MLVNANLRYHLSRLNQNPQHISCRVKIASTHFYGKNIKSLLLRSRVLKVGMEWSGGGGGGGSCGRCEQISEVFVKIQKKYLLGGGGRGKVGLGGGSGWI